MPRLAYRFSLAACAILLPLGAQASTHLALDVFDRLEADIFELRCEIRFGA